MHTRAFLTATAAALLVVSCVTTGNIEDLQYQVNSLKDEVDVLKKTSLDTKASTGADYDSVMEEVKSLRGTYEEKNHQFEQKSEEIDILKEVVNRSVADIERRLFAIEERLSAIEKTLDTKPIPGNAAPISTPEKTTTNNITTGSGENTAVTDKEKTGDDLYVDAYKKYQSNDYNGSIEEFTRFIADNPGSSLADNAQFWIAESYYAQKDFDRAIIEYDTVIKKYPSADKVPSAMLNEGLAFLEIGDKTSAKMVLSNLIKKYPKDPQAETAKKKLDTL